MSKILGESLPEEALNMLRSKIPSVVVATVSREGEPNTTPVHLIYAKDQKTILMAMALQHQGTANIKDNGKVMICMCEENDINVSIKGKAEVVREPMECNKAMCMIKVDVANVKDDSTHSETTSGIRYRCVTERGERFIRDIFTELENCST
ncbi:MAG: pyridoxamine 5'-phosphate oxidase family protein [Thermoplasmata archaeon]